MIFLRIVAGVRDHFESRFFEWVMGLTLVWWGLRLVGPEDAWSNQQAWRNMLDIMSENAWGWVFILVGVARIIALTVNGTFQDTFYARYSPQVRALTATASAILWFMVEMSVINSSSSGAGIYHLPLIIELWCMRHAWKEAGRIGHSPRKK